MYISKSDRAKLLEEMKLAQIRENKERINETVLMEGTWKLPFDVESATKLKKFMEKAQPQETAADNLYYIFGDDELFDNISEAKDPTDVRFEVKTKLRELLKAYDNGELKTKDTIDQETRKILNSILEVSLNEEILKSRNGSPIKVGCKVKVVSGPDDYKNCTGKVDWVGDNQCVVIFDDGKPVKQNLLDCNQLEVIKTNELDETTLMEDEPNGDGQVQLADGENISVEVDGEIVTDPPIEESNTDVSVEEYGPKLGITDMILQAINDENTTIQYYNNMVAACNAEGFTDIANVIKHINEEENIHVGMLQHAMSTISEQAKTIEDGVIEAAEIMSGNLEAAHEEDKKAEEVGDKDTAEEE